jgi:cytochrome c5
MRRILGISVALIGVVPATQVLAASDGQDVYTKNCAVCHNNLKPKIGDKAVWEPLIKNGEDALVAAVIKGKGTMPPRGGKPALTDDEIKAAVQYIENKSK